MENSTELRQKITAAQQKVADLEQERSLLLDNLDEASRAGDVAKILQLRTRGDELPMHILAQRLEVERLLLAEIDDSMPAVSQAAQDGQAALDAAKQAFRDARVAQEAQGKITKPLIDAHNAMVRRREEHELRIRNMERALFSTAAPRTASPGFASVSN